MQHFSELNWVDDLKFDVLQNGKTFRVDGNHDEVNSTGFRPKALILSSLAGCTAIDVVELLKKMRVDFSDFKITVSGNLTEEHPKIYDTVTLNYNIRLVNQNDRDKVQKTVDLSQEKYCGVSAMVRTFAKLDIAINYL